jgi:hypothetical protein
MRRSAFARAIPNCPTWVCISINTSLLAHQPEVIRSTAAREFAPAIFDMPAILEVGPVRLAARGIAQIGSADLGGGGNIRRTFRTTAAPTIARPGAPIDWVEWRQAVKLAQTA